MVQMVVFVRGSIILINEIASRYVNGYVYESQLNPLISFSTLLFVHKFTISLNHIGGMTMNHHIAPPPQEY